MNIGLIEISSSQYDWKLSLISLVVVVIVPFVAGFFLKMVPAIKEIQNLNSETAVERNKRSYYKAVQVKSISWGVLSQLLIFALIIPFVITDQPQSFWNIALDIFVILMFYDFFYYLTHRFLFHDGPLGGPLLWVHAVHHQQKNPCRQDSSYLHPIEICMGLFLYGASIAVLAIFMGKFHIITVILTWITFQEINRHNHNLMEIDRFPFKYLKFLSFMHHVHHARFTAGNYATISLFYDWLFGTYDTGNGFRKADREKSQS